MKTLIEFHNLDYRGRAYDQFHARRDPASGPGWYVYGRNEEYGGMLVHLCARPSVKPRKHPHYNVQVRRGWHTLREAKAVADTLNARANLLIPVTAPLYLTQ